jgi:hypothetical protein
MSLEQNLRDLLREVDKEPAPDLSLAIGPRLTRRPRWPSMILVASIAIAVLSIGIAYGQQSAHLSSGDGPASAAAASAAVPPASTPGDTPAPSPLQSPDASPPTGSSPTNELAVATTAPGAPGSDALASGRLGGERRDGLVCWWLSQGSFRMALLWPFGFSAVDNPLRIIGPDGQSLAAVGDDVELGGGAPPVDYVPTPAQDPCDVGHLYGVSVVGTVNGQRVDIGEGSLTLVTRAPSDAMSCPLPFLEPIMLVMTDGRLRLRTGGHDVDASWPAGFSALPGNRIRIVDAQGVVVIVQGVQIDNARGITAGGRIDVCGFGATIYR